MSESTLSIDYDDLEIELGRFLGYPDVDPANWSAAQIAEVERYIQAGYRQFLYPPAVEGVEAGYPWSFLTPTTTIETESAYTTGSLAVVNNGTATCTLTGGVWPTWAATHGTLTIGSTVYTISSRDGDTVLTVVGVDVTAAEDGWSLAHAGYQDLPDDLGRIVGDLHFEADVYWRPITQVSEHQIQALLQRDDSTNRPVHAAVRYKASDSTGGQRREIVWWPKPDDDYTLTYRYEAFQAKLVKTTAPYPLGGMKYSELVVESCLAIAEQRANDEKGIHSDAFVRLLAAAIEQDRQSGPRYFGALGEGESDEADARRRRLQGSSYDITYKGATW